jgi:hypothetical protein
MRGLVIDNPHNLNIRFGVTDGPWNKAGDTTLAGKCLQIKNFR